MTVLPGKSMIFKNDETAEHVGYPNYNKSYSDRKSVKFFFQRVIG